MKGYSFVDIETSSPFSIKDSQYIVSKHTKIISVVVLENNKLTVYCDRLDINRDCKPLSSLQFNLNTIFVSHHGEHFDERVLEAKGYKLPSKRIDTKHISKQNGLPGSLDELAKIFGIEGKKDSSAIDILSKAKFCKNGKVEYPIGTISLWQKMIDYNIQDVRLLKRLFVLLKPLVQSIENSVIELHRKINKRGLKIDTYYTGHLINMWEEIKKETKEEILKLTNNKLTIDDLRSHVKVKNYIVEKYNLKLSSLSKSYIDRLFSMQLEESEALEDGQIDIEAVKELLVLRSLVTRVGSSKLVSMIEHCNKYYIVSHWCQYFGGLTGRFSGQGIQPQNFVRGVEIKDNKFFTSDFTYKDVIDYCTSNKILPSDLIGTLTRSCIIPNSSSKQFSIIDYAGIEARGTAWIADCKPLLHQFSIGADVYKWFGSMLFDKPENEINKEERYTAKQIVLGCGYQMGEDRFGLMCEVYKVDLKKVGLTANQAVRFYRNTFPEIVQSWKVLHTTIIDMVQNQRYNRPTKACKCTFEFIKYKGIDCLNCLLPSGRIIRYWKPYVAMEYPKKFHSDAMLPHFYYWDSRGFYSGLYGGKLLENIVQAISRDILVTAMVDLDNNGYDICLHIHDEIVCECSSDRLNDMKQIMVHAGARVANGMPIDVSGFTFSRLRK